MAALVQSKQKLLYSVQHITLFTTIIFPSSSRHKVHQFPRPPPPSHNPASCGAKHENGMFKTLFLSDHTQPSPMADRSQHSTQHPASPAQDGTPQQMLLPVVLKNPAKAFSDKPKKEILKLVKFNPKHEEPRSVPQLNAATRDKSCKAPTHNNFLTSCCTQPKPASTPSTVENPLLQFTGMNPDTKWHIQPSRKT